jgi:hypothetical protein
VVSLGEFRHEILAQFKRASVRGEIDMLMTSGELHRSICGRWGSKDDMSNCCDAMKDELQGGDTFLVDAGGLGMTINFKLPRLQLTRPNVRKLLDITD